MRALLLCGFVAATGATAIYRAFRISLVDLQPYPFSSRTILPSEYRATLTVTRL